MKLAIHAIAAVSVLKLFSQPVLAQQVTPPSRTGLSADVGTGAVIDKRTIFQLRCAAGTASPKQCAKFGFSARKGASKSG